MSKKLVAIAALMAAGFIYTPVIHAQYVFRQAQSQAQVNNYVEAKGLYEKAYNKNKNIAAARGLAEIYTETKDYVLAESWWTKVNASNAHIPQDEMQYAEVLMNNSKYGEAATILEKYISKNIGDQHAQNLLEGCRQAKNWLQNPVRGALENMKELNSAYSDWGLVKFGDRFFFASDRPGVAVEKPSFFSSTGNIKQNAYAMTGNNYLHLFEAAQNNGSVKPLSKSVNSGYHAASASFTADSSEMYYAVTDYVKKPASFLGKSQPYTLNVLIISGKYNAATQELTNINNFPFNDIYKYSLGDPCISPDGKTLYFASNNGFAHIGGTDIYYTTKDINGQWDIPKNMGPEINTTGDERTPFVDAEGNLYFASNGRAGMGGLDIYKATPARNKGGWIVTNMGSPVNSPQDDFAPFFGTPTEMYFSSNRTGGKGSDDIYRFNIDRILRFTTGGTVKDKETVQPLTDVVLTLVNKTNGTRQQTVTDFAGKYNFDLDSLTDYELIAEKTGYATKTIPVTTKGMTSSSRLPNDIFLEKVVVGKPVVLENVYFDFDKWNIRSDAEKDLDMLVQAMKDNPTWKIEMTSHTDARGKAKYNMKLSQKRADATMQYLIDHGIDANRIKAKGYGATKPVNGCIEGVKCTEEQYQQNRRTEFIIRDN